MEVVIVSNARTPELKRLTDQAIKSSGVSCVVVEQNPDVSYSCKTIHYTFPFNYNKCLNLGFQFTTDDVVAFVNNDVLFGSGWMECEKYLKDYGSISLLNPGWGFHKDFVNEVHEGYNIGRELCGWCIIATRDTIKDIGGFDEGVEFWTSDNIYALQLQCFNIKHALITKYTCTHLTSKTLCSGLDKKQFAHYTGGQVPFFEEAKKKYL